MDKQSVILYFLSLLIMTAALKINSIRVPEIELLDTNKSVILDCDFDAGDDTDLVVKWFHEDNLIYQWIMNHDPQEVGAFKGKLDLTYKATDDKISMYRALKIKHLSLDLAGEYKCVVFNYMSEDSMSKKMIIVNGPQKIEMLQLSPEDDDLISVTCSAYGVYPEPIVNITYTGTGSNLFQDIENQSIKNEDGLYNVTQVVTLNVEQLEDATEFICELSIPETNFTIDKTLTFIPGSLTTESDPELNDTATEILSAEDNAAVLMPTWIMVLLAIITSILST